MGPRRSTDQTYKGTAVDKITAVRDRLVMLANNKKFTPTTRALAREEVAYLDLLLEFRKLPEKLRTRCIRKHITPWENTWSAPKDSNTLAKTKPLKVFAN